MRAKTRNETIEVTDLSSLPTTDRECYDCEDGHFVQDGHELVCDNCQFTPSYETRSRRITAWESHREEVDARAEGAKDGRPRLVGGYPDAYWGEGEYEYSPIDGFSF